MKPSYYVESKLGTQKVNGLSRAVNVAKKTAQLTGYARVRQTILDGYRVLFEVKPDAK